ncbi:MAG: hypothetical protein B6D61_13800 [Bacteroidetes bacterium 4484_249]|nr:MAG: hypothetical protein B6D61_13800 [Bacteroidetes bacterium 4484_249]
MTKIIATLFILLFSAICFAQDENNQAVSFTLADRDRLIRNEAAIKSLRNEMNSEIGSLRNEMKSLRNEMKSLRNEMNTKFEAQQIQFNSFQKQFDNFHTLMYFILGGIFSLIILIFWDRRSAIAPAKKEIANIINVLKQYAEENPKLAEILRNAGIL